MTNAELIEKLKTMPPYADVSFEIDEEFITIDSVEAGDDYPDQKAALIILKGRE